MRWSWCRTNTSKVGWAFRASVDRGSSTLAELVARGPEQGNHYRVLGSRGGFKMATNPPVADVDDIPDATISALEALAGILLERGYQPDHRLIIVPIIGAGASASAGLPTSYTLKTALLDKYVGPDNRGRMHHALTLEAKKHFPSASGNVLETLSLFEFCAVLSTSEYGKQCLEAVLTTELTQPTHRPITYELLAHFAKHRFIDHLISLNFDRLLDDALREELPGKHWIVGSEDDLPGPSSILPRVLARDACCLFKPFGSIITGKYALRPEELKQYGPHSVWNFCLHHIFLQDNARVGVVLLLIGYAANEPAFRQLITSLQNAGKHVVLFSIDTASQLADSLQQLNTRHIQLDADTALTLLAEFMRLKRGSKIWIPVARHHVISTLLNYAQLSDHPHPGMPRIRFELEILLQAVKSRGFFTLEAVAEIERIRIYDRDAYSRLRGLCEQGILSPQPWGAARDHRYDVTMQDYQLVRTHPELAVSTAKMANKDPDTPIHRWDLVHTCDRYRPIKVVTSLGQYLENKFEEISQSPDIEILGRNPSTCWTFSRAREIRSMPELERRTLEIFTSIHDSPSMKVDIRLISSTAEWIFHKEGWAYREIGRDILERMRKGTANVRMVLLDPSNSSWGQKSRLDAVLSALKEVDMQNRYHTIQYLGWWRLNRRLTLITAETQKLYISDEDYLHP
jgi:hypothetical protein